MSDKITTLHLKNDPSTNIYPNVKIENIPLDVTITRDGENLAKTKTIYDFTHLNFLSLDGGTMNGIITINDIGIPEKTILGDGVEVIEVSNPANPATHYGCGYIRQDDDEDTSVKYEYNFPKKSGTIALKENLESYAPYEKLGNIWSVIDGQDFAIYTQESYRIGNLIFTRLYGHTGDRGITSTTPFITSSLKPNGYRFISFNDGGNLKAGSFTTSGQFLCYGALGTNRINIDITIIFSADE